MMIADLLRGRSFVRETCYLDGEKVNKYPNSRKYSKDLCMALTESDSDPDAEALWVREYLDGEAWQFSGRCSRVGREEETCRFRR